MLFRPVPDENSPASSSRSGLNTSVSVRKSKSGSAKSVSKKKSDDLWNGMYDGLFFVQLFVIFHYFLAL